MFRHQKDILKLHYLTFSSWTWVCTYVIPPFPFSNLNVRRGLKGLSVPNLGLLWISFLNIWLVVRFLLVCIIRKKACKQRKLIWTTYWAENYPNENEFMCHFRESLVAGLYFSRSERSQNLKTKYYIWKIFVEFCIPKSCVRNEQGNRWFIFVHFLY